MTSAGLLAGFLVAATVICLTPGPDMLYVASFGISRGWRGGTAAAAGIAVGMAVHTVLAALGLSPLIAHSPLAFTGLKIAGAGYLLHLGVGMVRSPHQLHATSGADSAYSYPKITRQATIVNILNPKIIIFYITFLPQFVQRPGAPVYLQMLTLGALFVLMGFATDTTVGIFSARLTARLTTDSRLTRRIGTLGGTTLCLLAALLVTEI
jgi:threonine/homoserine/homoserine lactone efflux protein